MNMTLLDDATNREIDDGSSRASLVLMVLIVLLLIGGLFVAMYGLPTFRAAASPEQALRVVSIATIATVSTDQLPALVPPHTSGFSPR